MKKLHAFGVVALVVAGGALCVTSAMAAKDNFNRSMLGKKWVATAGTIGITNDQFTGSTGALGYYKKSSKNTEVSATVYTNGTGLEYGAVASGDIAGGNNAFAKVQGEGDGAFQQAAFYTGNNGGGEFFDLTSEVPSPARLKLSFCGTVATLTITSSAPEQQYSYDYGTSFGTGGGLGTYGEVSLDNYKSKGKGDCVPSPNAIRITHSTAVDPTHSK